MFPLFNPNIICYRRVLHTRSQFDLKTYIQTLKKDDSDLKNSPSVNFITYHIRTCLNFKDNYLSRGKVKKYVQSHMRLNLGIYLSLSYLLIKLIYFAIVFFQLFMLNYWLRDDHYKDNILLGAYTIKLNVIRAF